jgi:hypothetical protein
MAKAAKKKDTNQYAKSIVDILTGEKPKPKVKKALNVKGKR